MSDFKRNQLRRQLIAIILACLLLPSLTVAWMGYGEVLATIRAEKIRNVGRIADIRRIELLGFLRGAKQRNADFLSDVSDRCFNWPDPIIIGSCIKEALNLFAKNESALKAIMYLPEYGYIGNGDSRLYDAAMREPLRPGQLARFSEHGAQGERIYEIIVEEPRRNLQLIVIYPARLIDGLFMIDKDLGESGETFLSDNEGFFITPARYKSTQGHSHPISAYPMRTCLSANNKEVLDLDYRDVPIIHGFRYIPEIGGGCIMAHIDQAEAFGPLRDLELRISLLVALFVAAAVVISFKLSQRIAQPVASLTEATREIINGNYDHRVQVGGNNEISELAMFFNPRLSIRQNPPYEASLRQGS
jgi:HAMP domain-containing protein